MAGLSDKKCVPCRDGTLPLTSLESSALAGQIDGWTLVNNHHIEKERRFPNFTQALNFVIAVGTLADEQGHHPDIYLSWGKTKVTIWTHKINGLTESDFILASKIDQI